jgi:hypothetical protein
MLRLRNPRELYRTAFQGGPKDYYTGINPASKSRNLSSSVNRPKRRAWRAWSFPWSQPR